MGLAAPITGTGSITTTPVNIDSTGIYIHHIRLFITSTIGASDSYTVSIYVYDPLATTWTLSTTDTIDYTSSSSGTFKVWEVNPRVCSGIRLTLTKTTGNDATYNYEIIKAA